MSSRFTTSLLFSLALSPFLSAETRPWKSIDGVRTLHGDCVKRDSTSVTLRTQTGQELTVELSKLAPEESIWLDTHHPIKSVVTESSPATFFDTLTFNDTRESALTKLKASTIVEMTTDETFIGRSGLNGIFRTRRKIGNLDGFLYFNWSETGKLKELTLQTNSRPGSAYKSEIEPSWKKCIELLDTLYGKATVRGQIPPIASLADGTFTPSHFWKIDTGGYALLGTAREGENYQLVVRFTQSKAALVEER